MSANGWFCDAAIINFSTQGGHVFCELKKKVLVSGKMSAAWTCARMCYEAMLRKGRSHAVLAFHLSKSIKQIWHSPADLVWSVFTATLWWPVISTDGLHVLRVWGGSILGANVFFFFFAFVLLKLRMQQLGHFRNFLGRKLWLRWGKRSLALVPCGHIIWLFAFFLFFFWDTDQDNINLLAKKTKRNPQKTSRNSSLD